MIEQEEYDWMTGISIVLFFKCTDKIFTEKLKSDLLKIFYFFTFLEYKFEIEKYSSESWDFSVKVNKIPIRIFFRFWSGSFFVIKIFNYENEKSDAIELIPYFEDMFLSFSKFEFTIPLYEIVLCNSISKYGLGGMPFIRIDLICSNLENEYDNLISNSSKNINSKIYKLHLLKSNDLSKLQLIDIKAKTYGIDSFSSSNAILLDFEWEKFFKVGKQMFL